MARHQLFGLSFRVIMFFGRNLEEELTTLDIAEKFDVDVRDVPAMLRRAVEGKLLSRPARGGPGAHGTYAAGPALFHAVGVAMEACAPVGPMHVQAGGR
jgi:hypothetical protein